MEPTAQPNIVSGSVAPETQKKKTNISAIVLGLTTVLFAGAAVFFGMQYFTNSKLDQSDTPNSQQPPSDSGPESNALSMAKEFEKVKDAMKEIISGTGVSSTAIQSGSGLPIKPNGLNTYLMARFALEAEIKHDSSNADTELTLKNNLSEAGFNSIGILPFSGSAGPRIDGYANSEGIVCGLYSDIKYVTESYQYEYTSLACGKKDWTWLTDDEMRLVSSLENAFYAKTGEYPVILYGFGGDVKDSEYKPYQTLTVGVGGARGLFYRTSPDAEWQFFTAGRNGLQ